MASNAGPALPSAMSTDAPRRCFICLMDQLPSDAPDTWVDPCPCTLEAHQDCMQSWVTDCERSNKPLRCPVCKSDIHLVSQFDPILALNEALAKRFNRASPLILLTGTSMGLGLALEAYGIGAMWAVAGRKATWRFILGEGMKYDAVHGGTIRKRALLLMGAAPVLLTNKLLPSVTMKLALPFVSFFTMYHAMHDPGFFTWPPSPQLAMVLIPYLRSTYYNLWRETLLPYEIKLNRQLLGLPPLPENNDDRENDNQEGERNNNNRGDQRNPDGLVGMLQGLLDALDPDDEELEGNGAGGDVRVIQREVNAGALGGLELELVIEEVEAVNDDANDDLAAQEPLEDAPHQPLETDALAAQEEGPHGAAGVDENENNDAAAPPPVIPMEAPAAAAPPAPENHEAPQAPPARRPSLGTILLNISNAVVSALALPMMSFAAGELLRLVLPRTWTTMPSWLRRPTGLLQQQWGRSVVGGCVYVVVSDLMRVYAKHRKVAAIGTRKVKNVERRRR